MERGARRIDELRDFFLVEDSGEAVGLFRVGPTRQAAWEFLREADTNDSPQKRQERFLRGCCPRRIASNETPGDLGPSILAIGNRQRIEWPLVRCYEAAGFLAQAACGRFPGFQHSHVGSTGSRAAGAFWNKAPAILLS